MPRRPIVRVYGLQCRCYHPAEVTFRPLLCRHITPERSVNVLRYTDAVWCKMRPLPCACEKRLSYLLPSGRSSVGTRMAAARQKENAKSGSHSKGTPNRSSKGTFYRII